MDFEPGRASWTSTYTSRVNPDTDLRILEPIEAGGITHTADGQLHVIYVEDATNDDYKSADSLISMMKRQYMHPQARVHFISPCHMLAPTGEERQMRWSGNKAGTAGPDAIDDYSTYDAF